MYLTAIWTRTAVKSPLRHFSASALLARIEQQVPWQTNPPALQKRDEVCVSVLKRPSKYTRFVLPIKEQLIFYRKFGLEIKGFFSYNQVQCFQLESWVWLTWQIQHQDPSPRSLEGQLQTGKKSREDTENSSNTPVGMEVQGRIGKISKWICTTTLSTSLAILWMEKHLSSRSAVIYAFIIYCRRSEFLNANYWVVKHW